MKIYIVHARKDRDLLAWGLGYLVLESPILPTCLVHTKPGTYIVCEENRGRSNDVWRGQARGTVNLRSLFSKLGKGVLPEYE